MPDIARRLASGPIPEHVKHARAALSEEVT
jgi:hypothetical protein